MECMADPTGSVDSRHDVKVGQIANSNAVI